MLSFIIVDSCSNLFPKELMLTCPIMRWFMLFILISFRKDCGSFISVSFEFVRGELDDRKMLGNISDCTKILLLQFTDHIVKNRANRGN